MVKARVRGVEVGVAVAVAVAAVDAVMRSVRYYQYGYENLYSDHTELEGVGRRESHTLHSPSHHTARVNTCQRRDVR